MGLREGEWLLRRGGIHRRKCKQPQSSTFGNVQLLKRVFVQLTNKRAWCRASFVPSVAEFPDVHLQLMAVLLKQDGPSLGGKLGLSSGGSRCLVAGTEVARAGSSPSPR